MVLGPGVATEAYLLQPMARCLAELLPVYGLTDLIGESPVGIHGLIVSGCGAAFLIP